MTNSEMEEEVSPLERELSLCVVLPGGLEKNAIVHGSKPVMDLLVTLCASHHLNPSDYTVEVLSSNKNLVSFKPNSPVGLLEADRIVLKPKTAEEKIRQPYMPEATVRLLINYNRCHKTVLRVNPRIPLEALLPLVCDKCELEVESTVLLRDAQARDALDLSRSLDELGLREVFAKDTAVPERYRAQEAEETAEVILVPPRLDLPKKEKKQKENSGFFSLFRRRKKKHEVNGRASAPASPGLCKQASGVSRSFRLGSASSDTLAATDAPKKRRAPLPPMGASLSVPNNLNGPQRSGDSTLRSTKKRAAPPPPANALQELQKDAGESLKPLEELRENQESDSLSPSSPSSPHPSQSSSARPSLSNLHEPYLPSFKGKDLSDARTALAKVLMSSVSKGTLIKRLKNSANLSKLPHGSSTTRCSDYDFSPNMESVLGSDLPTQNDWQSPVGRRGLSTFRVIPRESEQLSPDPEECREAEPKSESSNEAENPQEEELRLCSNRLDFNGPNGSNQETQPSSEVSPNSDKEENRSVKPLEDDLEEPQEEEASSRVKVEELTEGIQEEVRKESISEEGELSRRPKEGPEEEEDEEKDEEVHFPPPPPPVFFKEDIDDEVKIDPAQRSLPPTQTLNRLSKVPEEEKSTPAESQQPANDVAPSRFAQAVARALQRSGLPGHRKGPESPGFRGLQTAQRSTYQYGA